MDFSYYSVRDQSAYRAEQLLQAALARQCVPLQAHLRDRSRLPNHSPESGRDYVRLGRWYFGLATERDPVLAIVARHREGVVPPKAHPARGTTPPDAPYPRRAPREGVGARLHSSDRFFDQG